MALNALDNSPKMDPPAKMIGANSQQCISPQRLIGLRRVESAVIIPASSTETWVCSASIVNACLS